ncbi:hypothetical protein [Roseomonas indoligenes]|uniref:Uncharacterized protein n=1 Tax=Roseomonas indoligenes TaxID=2820811 RepID=A0A940MQK6_9PROT|nr:hypothetical protein [Pararoseomonas indoligenes]MBP0492198.1 hypothetical protein [Pararoseomonas indoligenes]
MADNVVPFGKYKGKPVEDMLADAGYMEWIGAQPWFRERFGHLLDAHDRAEAEATPIHNRLQALFLDPVYQAAFAQIAAGERIAEEIAKELRSREDIREEIRGLIAAQVEAAQKAPDSTHCSYGKDISRNSLIAAGEGVLAQLANLGAPSFSLKVAFEAPQDVVLGASLPSAGATSAGSYRLGLDGLRLTSHTPYEPTFTLRVEIKPVIGDDYPVVLRQMTRNGSRHLFLGRYEGVGADEAQFIAIFKASGKNVVFKDQVDRLASEMRGRG